MKIRTGFISNSSTSSFIVIYLPDNFDYDVHMEYMLDRPNKNWEKTYIKKINYRDFKKFKKNNIYREEAEEDKFYGMECFLYPFYVDRGDLDVEEGRSEIQLTRWVDKTVKKDLEDKCKVNEEKYGDKAEKRKKRRIIQEERREKKRIEMLHVDPYGEEDWIEDEENDSKLWNESMRIKKFSEY